MASSFLIRLSKVSSTPEDTLRDEIRAHTGNDEEADSILRGIERLGRDPSIAHFEMTRKENRPAYRGAQRVSWSVRAVRP
ncbi:hypothetical protein [Longimicrobium sp.]|uniref:hypothetical protein n=1 Tax=Longimicrobium sp. TaxID=2029185 RepID=UPI002D060567|nr:hypothetical protein [Longimicrobium sp.]HSU13580.1 hypothetical protein [Longimicrobium sp.]